MSKFIKSIWDKILNFIGTTKAIISFFRSKQNIENQLKTLEDKKKALSQEIYSLQEETNCLKQNIVVEQYQFSSYEALSSQDCKNKLALIKIREQELLKTKNPTLFSTSKKLQTENNNLKQLLRCFNAECDNILLNLSAKNIDNSRNKICRSYETLNKIFSTDGISISKELLSIKLEELNLVHTYELKKELEREQKREIKAQMLEEEKARKEIENQQKQVLKDKQQFTNEINRLTKYMQNTNFDSEKQLYIDKIKELEDKLKKLELAQQNLNLRMQNAKAGFVYVISNIGSFGENVYKIGMTRRLEPMDRIRELSNASVPFPFDVHAIIFSENAPELEQKLHNHFNDMRVNKINNRKEFFRVNMIEIEQFIKANFNNTVKFTEDTLSSEYRESILEYMSDLKKELMK